MFCTFTDYVTSWLKVNMLFVLTVSCLLRWIHLKEEVLPVFIASCLVWGHRKAPGAEGGEFNKVSFSIVCWDMDVLLWYVSMTPWNVCIAHKDQNRKFMMLILLNGIFQRRNSWAHITFIFVGLSSVLCICTEFTLEFFDFCKYFLVNKSLLQWTASVSCLWSIYYSYL